LIALGFGSHANLHHSISASAEWRGFERPISREEDVAKLGTAIGFHGAEALRQLQIVEI
jgi:hypothetical protein